MNALEFHKLFVEQNNSNQGKSPLIRMTNQLPSSGFKPEFPVSDIKNDPSTFPWGFILVTCATIGLIIYLRNKAQKRVPENLEKQLR